MEGATRHRWVRVALLALFAACLLVGCGPSTGEVKMGKAKETPNAKSAEPPNIVLVLVDDLDAGSVKHMSRLNSLLVERGTAFENAFVTNSLCCPSRATILRGQYTHNHRVLRNAAPQGGFEKFRTSGDENSTVATWLDDAGYRTMLVGKYFNGAQHAPTYVPPGWDEWYGWVGSYDDSLIKLNENGEVVTYDPERHHDTDVFADKAMDFVLRAADDERPFFMYLAPNAPHRPILLATRHREAFAVLKAPRPPSFDEHNVSDKPRWVRDKPALTPQKIAYIDDLYRGRLRELLAVDEMIGRLIGTLEDAGELSNTYVFFTSDNGYHLGEHGLFFGKWTAYEEDIGVPLVVRGPGVPEGRKVEEMALNNDLAPTFADLAGIEAPSFVDGRSLVPLLKSDPPPPEQWRNAFLVEAAAEVSTRRPAFAAVRTEDHLYVEYVSGEHELYDLGEDPYQLNNGYKGADTGLLWYLEARLAALRGCAGTVCRVAEGGHQATLPFGVSVR